jgi:peptide/nickel transport system ATP-binding protein
MLEITNLNTRYRTDEGAEVHAVDGVSISLGQNETLGLVGESGCGKSTFAESLIRLLPTNGEVTEGTIDFKGTDLTELSDNELRKQIRWTEISMIPQNAMNSFDPVHTVGEQVVQAIRTHDKDCSKKEAWARTRSLFEDLNIDEDRVRDYPHQFSGGMAQRAMIALALCLEPSLVLADEPTTALDVVVQDRILNMIQELQDELNSSMILITHDMSVVSETCDDIAVMYGGRIVEYADAETVIKNPRHPYTLGMRNAFPDISKDTQELISIPGQPPKLIDPDEGCKFAPRCPFAEEQCWEETPQPEEFEDGHIVECHRADEREYLQEEAAKRETWLETEEGAKQVGFVDGGTNE